MNIQRCLIKPTKESSWTDATAYLMRDFNENSIKFFVDSSGIKHEFDSVYDYQLLNGPNCYIVL